MKNTTCTDVKERIFYDKKGESWETMENILFYARKAVTVPFGKEDNTVLAMTAVKNLSDLGFIPDGPGVEALKTASAPEITNWYYRTEKRFRELAGADHEYNPFYPNFPEQVMEASELELFLDQITHYISVVIEDIAGVTGSAWQPGGENRKKGKKSLEEHPLKVITTIREDRLEDTVSDIFRNTLASKLIPSKEDTEKIINAYTSADPEWTKKASVVENRKVLSYLYTLAIVSGKDTAPLPPLVTGDYLRIAQVYSRMRSLGTETLQDANTDRRQFDGRVKQQRVTHLSKPLVRFFADGLDQLPNLEEDIQRNREQWKAIFRLMHVGTIKNKPRLAEAARKLRDGKKPATFYSEIDNAYRKGNYEKAVRMYASRPGEFLHALNRMLNVKVSDTEKRKKYAELLYQKAEETFPKARTEDLIRLVAYLRSRVRTDRLNIHSVKGKLVQTEKKHGPLDTGSAEAFIQLAKKAIAQQVKQPSCGKVYIDDMLDMVPLPTEITDASDAMNAWPRGTRIPIEKNEDGTPKNIRVFVWWTNIDRGGHTDRVDLDLSAELFHKAGDKPEGALCEWEGSVSFHGTYNKFDGTIVHSGDITDGGAPGGDGVCEYVDINVKKLQEECPNVDYIQIYINSYTGQPFSDVPCLGGWQEREELCQSDQFDPKAVKQTSMLACAGRGVSMAVVDVKNAEIVWMDAPYKKAVAASTSLDAAGAFDIILDRYMKGDQMTMKEMAGLFVEASGGELTESMEEADIVFSMDAIQDVKEGQRVITAKDQDIWLGEFMCPQEKKTKEEEKSAGILPEEAEKEPEKSVAGLIAEIAASK